MFAINLTVEWARVYLCKCIRFVNVQLDFSQFFAAFYPLKPFEDALTYNKQVDRTRTLNTCLDLDQAFEQASLLSCQA